jgi:hypothetical protein
MRETHKGVFFNVAQQFTCWIGLREPNELTDKWIGRAGYQPKGEACKAKTADNPVHRLGGLVVDPTRCPDAFKPATLRTAIDTWEKKFLIGGRLPMNFTRIESGTEMGLVKHNGAFMYADFDLMAIIRSNAQGEFLPTSNAEQKQLYAAVEPVLNRGLGVRLIQHGAEFMWDQGVGARESEFVLWFGPRRRFNRWPSSMPKGGH